MNRSNDGLTLRAPGERIKVSTDEARTVLEQWQMEVSNSLATSDGNVSVHTWDISFRSWPVETLQVWKDFVPQYIVPTVVCLHFDDIIASLPTDDGLSSVAWLVQQFIPTNDDDNTTAISLPSLAVRELHLNLNALGIRGMLILQPLLEACTKAGTLEQLYLNDCGLSLESCEILLKVMGSSAAATMTSTAGCPLKVFHIDRNQIGVDGAKCMADLLAVCTQLVDFSYAGCRPLVNGTRFICQGLARAMVASGGITSFQHLNLHDCHFNSGEDEADPIHILCQVVSNSPHLQTLNLNDGEMEASGLGLLLDAVTESKSAPTNLRHLNIGGNNIGVEGADLLVKTLQHHPTFASSLRTLQCDTNELESHGLAVLMPHLATCCTELEVLSFNDNQIEGLEAILQHPIPSLRSLSLLDNMDLNISDVAEAIVMYPGLQVDDDVRAQLDGADDNSVDNENGDYDNVDDLVTGMSQATL